MKIIGVLALYIFLILNSNTIKAAENNQTNCGLVRSFQVNSVYGPLVVLPNGFLANTDFFGVNGINIWDPENGNLVISINTTTSMLIVSHDGALISGTQGAINFFDPKDGKLLNAFQTEELFSPFSLALLENGYLAAGSMRLDVSIEIWNINNNSLVKRFDTHYLKGVASLAYLKNDLLASADGVKGIIDIWNFRNGQLERTLNGHADAVNFLLTLKNGSLISGSEDKTIKVWDPKSGDLLNTWTGHTGSVNTLAEFPEGFLASGGDDGIKLWNLSNGKLFASFENSQASSIVALSNGYLASMSSDSNDLKIWNVKDCF